MTRHAALSTKPGHRALAAAATFTLLVAVTGCTSRTLVIRSTPPGASVTMDGKLLGETPLETPFTWYGTRDFLLIKRGPSLDEFAVDPTIDRHAYRLHQLVELKRPISQTPGVDLFSDLLFPGDIEDRRELDFVLEPVPLPEDLPAAERDASTRALLDRADAARKEEREPDPLIVPVR